VVRSMHYWLGEGGTGVPQARKGKRRIDYLLKEKEKFSLLMRNWPQKQKREEGGEKGVISPRMLGKKMGGEKKTAAVCFALCRREKKKAVKSI